MQGRPVKVLHVLGRMEVGGIETWLLNVLRNIDRGRFRLDFCCLQDEPGPLGAEITSLNSRVIPLGPLRARGNVWTFGRRFRDLLRRGEYDVVHSHLMYFCGYLLWLAAKEGVPRRIAHSHNTSDGRASTPPRRVYRRLMKRWIAAYATHRLGASQAAAETLFGAASRGDSGPRVLHCGMDLDAFRQPVDRAAVRCELGIPANAPVVGHIGGFRLQKNHRGLVDIARLILQAEPETRFLLVGDGPLRADIEAIVRRQGMSDHFLFCGIRSDVPRLLAAMDVFLFPSRWEGLGLVLVEAQAAGVAVVAADLPGIREGVAPDPLNHLFALDSPQEAAQEVVRRLRSRRSNRQPPSPEMTQFLSAFDIHHCVRELQAIYT